MTDIPVDDQRPPNHAEVAQLRARHYNATLIDRIDIHSDLARFRLRPDQGVPSFAAGQYVALGLGYWEPRLHGTQGEELPAKKTWSLVRRAYSISCALLDDIGDLQTCSESDFLEFYVTLIREAAEPPALTPRLFQLHPGDRLFVQPRVVGAYTLSGIRPDDDVVLLATGTGEAPHNAMAAELLRSGHQGKIVVATCVRLEHDLGYLHEHGVLQTRFPNYCYLKYTTREPRNLNSTRADYVGLERLQSVFTNGRIAAEAGIDFDPKRTHVYLCGNPMMIGLHKPQDPPPDPPGMLQLLKAAGFHEETGKPGQVCYEKYW